MYVYIESENWRDDDGNRRHLYTVGFYKPDGKFESDTDHDTKDGAAERCNYLNGGMPSYELQIITQAAARMIQQ